MRTIDDLGDLHGKRILLRSDLNVPLEDGQVTDDGRIRASVPTITRLSDAGARVIVMAHLGRPAGKPDPRFSLQPVFERLAALLPGRDVRFADDPAGPSAKAAVEALPDGGVGLLENLRFDPRETSKDDAERGAFADELAALADAFVSDGFGVVHRKQASVYDIAQRLPHAAGDLVLAEVRAFAKVLDEPDRPYVVVLGGSKVSDQVDTVRGFVDRAAQSGVDLVLPVDIVVAPDVTEDAPTDVVSAGAIPGDQNGLDIGPATVRVFRDKLADARTVVWNGPMGVFELSPFATGTREIAEAVAAIDGTSVIGGGDSVAAGFQLWGPAVSVP